MRFAVEVIYQGRIETLYINGMGTEGVRSVAENSKVGCRVLAVRAT